MQTPRRSDMTMCLVDVRLLLGLEVVEEDGTLLRLLTPVLDNDAGAVDDLAGITLTVENACAGGND